MLFALYTLNHIFLQLKCNSENIVITKSTETLKSENKYIKINHEKNQN